MPGREESREPPGVAATARRLHVLHVSAAGGGGVGTLVADHVRHQVARGWQVSVACPSLGSLAYAARGSGARVDWWSVPGRGQHLVAGLRLREIVHEHRPDLVHLHGSRATRLGRLVVRDRIPVVVSPHRGNGGWPARLLGSAHTVLPPGVDLQRFSPAPGTDGPTMRSTLGLREQPTVVCVGSLEMRKGQQDLMTEWPAVRAELPGAQLVLVGDGPDRHRLEAFAAELPGVHFAGARADVPRWLAAADVVAVPSRHRRTGLSLVEAMAAARSVVALGVRGGTGPTLPPGAGALVAPSEQHRLAATLLTRLLDPELSRAEGQAGLAHVREHHDLRRTTRELGHLYLRLVQAHRTR